MKTVVVYHSIDLDGWMSAAIVKHFYEQDKFSNGELVNSITFLGYNYGQPIPDLSDYDKVIMCDISFPKEEMIKISHKLTWIDHHISAILGNPETIYLKYNGLRDIKFSACELTWKYFFPNENIPEIVRLLGRYDCFGHKGTDEEQKVLEFQYGARSVINNYEESYYYLNRSINSKGFYGKQSIPEDTILEKGKAIYSYLCTEAKQVYKNGFEIIFLDTTTKIYDRILSKDEMQKIHEDSIYKFICINRERFNPVNFGIDYHKDGYDGCACFHYADNKWKFSLYNDNGEVDCSAIAKQYGGGGHKGASGMVLNHEQFLSLIK